MGNLSRASVPVTSDCLTEDAGSSESLQKLITRWSKTALSCNVYSVKV